MNEAEIKAAIDGLPRTKKDEAAWEFCYDYEDHPFACFVAYADELATVWEIMASAAECHKLGNLSPWFWMSVPGFKCSYRFHKDGSTIPDGNFQEFKKAVEEEECRKALTANAKAGLDSLAETDWVFCQKNDEIFGNPDFDCTTCRAHSSCREPNRNLEPIKQNLGLPQ